MVTVSIRNSNFSLLSSSSLFSVPRFVSDLKKPSLYPQVSRSQIVFWHLFKKSEFSHFHRDIYIQIYFENMGYVLTVIWKDVCLISIDTSAKEVTKRLCNWEDVRKISIHTSAKEVTANMHNIPNKYCFFLPNFNPFWLIMQPFLQIYLKKITPSSIFNHFFKCESPRQTMFTPHSHFIK